MGKLLKALTVVFLLLSGGALALGILLFQKRELLKGRTQKLENAVIALAATIEADEPKAATRLDLPARDISPCRAEVLDTPELSTFWDNYSSALEEVDRPMLDLSRRKAELMQYYKIDPVTGKPERDEMGLKKTSGEGTMQAVLDELQAKAVAQHARLNNTRIQLRKVREELVNTITEANKTKRDLRTSLVKIDDLNKTVDRLNGQIADLKQQITDINRQLDEQKATVADQKKQIALLEEEKIEKDGQIALLKKEIEKLRLAGPPQ
ncbi:MAG: hypothetical protein N2255_10800, partial [Kiritimatiellae bacterium]|nr:hypothetical protein [Kiritimatiellia bacterium]